MHNELMKRKMLDLIDGALRTCGRSRSTEKKQLLREIRNEVNSCNNNFNQEYAREKFKSVVWAAAIHRNTGFLFGSKYRAVETNTISYIIKTLNQNGDISEFLFPRISPITNDFLRSNFGINDPSKSTKSSHRPIKGIVPKKVSVYNPNEDLPETYHEVDGIIVTRYRSDKILYRGDTRNPQALMQTGGFLPNISLTADRNNENVLKELAIHFPARISFTEDQEVAIRYMVRTANRQNAERSYMYYVNVNNMEVIDLNKNLAEGRLGRDLPPAQRERFAESWVDEKLVIGNRIPLDKIITVIEYTANHSSRSAAFSDCYNFDFNFEYRQDHLRRLLGN